MEEIWKDIKGFDYYQVSNLGRVKSFQRRMPIILKPSIVRKYLAVTMKVNGKIKGMRIHQLVAIAFLGHEPCGHKKTINHIDNNRFNNNLDNLEIVSNRENCNKKHLKHSSKYTGVSWRKDINKWYAQIWINGKKKALGFYDDEYEAHLVYEKEKLNIN